MSDLSLVLGGTSRVISIVSIIDTSTSRTMLDLCCQPVLLCNQLRGLPLGRFLKLFSEKLFPRRPSSELMVPSGDGPALQRSEIRYCFHLFSFTDCWSEHLLCCCHCHHLFLTSELRITFPSSTGVLWFFKNSAGLSLSV